MSDTCLTPAGTCLLAITMVEDLAIQFDPVGSWILVGAVTAILAVVLFSWGPTARGCRGSG
jgi:hypothetical protein